MKVFLAGYNVDADELQKLDASKVTLTPETFSAAYARISRSPKPVNELRQNSCQEVEQSRKSNESIIFEMGHSSVAEHAVFNFDVLGLSRLAVEALENFRLASFTEKSQRYITLQGDFVTPQELNADKSLEEIFKKTILKQNELYANLYEKLKLYVFEKHSTLAKDPKNTRLLEGWAKEDARYALCLATECQLGMTVNARTLEGMLKRFASDSFSEVRDLGETLYGKIKDIAPSIIRYNKKNIFDSQTYLDIQNSFKASDDGKSQEVVLVHCDSKIDNKIIASLIHTTQAVSYDWAMNKAKSMSKNEKMDFMKNSFRHMKFYDRVLREFEFGNFTFELVISASCFAQLKRHRMATITKQTYEPCLGVKIPDSIIEIGKKDEFMEVINFTNQAYEKISEKFGKNIGSYVLTNAHRRRVLLQVNARELYHIARLRQDAHAQWDIKQISDQMVKLAKKKAPLSMSLACGKDGFEKKYKKVFK